MTHPKKERGVHFHRILYDFTGQEYQRRLIFAASDGPNAIYIRTNDINIYRT